MSKKHFIALADYTRDFFATNAGREMDGISKGVLIDHLCRFAAAQNPRFNRQRWIGYVNGLCGPNGGSLRNADGTYGK